VVDDAAGDVSEVVEVIVDDEANLEASETTDDAIVEDEA
jgi:hypothetical protein